MDKNKMALIVLRYWFLVEFLNQPAFPKPALNDMKICEDVAKKSICRKQITVYHRLSSSWDIINELLNDSETYPANPVIGDECSICLGKMKRQDCIEYLRQRFGQEDHAPEKDNSVISLIGMKCDGQGCYIEKSFQISPLLWCLNRLQNYTGALNESELSSLLSLSDYFQDMMQFDDKLVIENEAGERVGAPLTETLCREIYDQVCAAYLFPILGGTVQADEGIIIYKRYQNEEVKAKDSESLYFSDLCKSFFTDDLQLLINRVESGTYGTDNPIQKAVIDYIVGAYAEEHPETGWIDFSQRIDIHHAWDTAHREEREDFFNQNLSIFLSPLGKWPSKYVPALMQQFAINFAMPGPLISPIFSVNGPPGTGKTTLLKEIIAGNIVNRAKLLTKYKDPDDAFVEKQFQDGNKLKNGYSKYCSVYYDFMDEQIKDYGMLVASCNNSAVENITKELPDGIALCGGLIPSENDPLVIQNGLSEIQSLFNIEQTKNTEQFSAWSGEGKTERREYPDIYFTKYANDLFGRKDGKWDCWGLISAPFGKASNINLYAQKVLLPFSRDFGTKTKTENRKESYRKAVQNFLDQLAVVEDLQSKISDVSSLRLKFKSEKQNLEREIAAQQGTVRAILQKIDSAKAQLCELQKRMEQARQEEKASWRQLEALQEKRTKQEQIAGEYAKNIEEIRQQIMGLEEKRKVKDYIWNIIGKTTMLLDTIREQYTLLEEKQKAKKIQDDEIGNLCRQARTQEEQIQRSRRQYMQLQRNQDKLNDQTAEFSTQIQELQSNIAELSEQIGKAKQHYCDRLAEARNTTEILNQMTVLDAEFWRLYDSENESENTKAQVLNPWFTPLYNREREKLFYMALQLHKEFMLASNSCAYNIRNLLLLWRVIQNDEKELVRFSKRDRQACYGALLNTIFLMTPVLSTTFASVGNMLSDIKSPGEIGYLIIDEAGQAQPQMAAGALYRCRRAIIVGDPKQVEPVVTGDMDAVKKIIRTEYNSCYQEKSHSVQEFADRINPVGTYLSDADSDDKIWVGCPLVVHRRCISPMYEISNSISYSNTMKQQTAEPKPEREARFVFERSCWLNVSGSEKNTKGKDHFVQSQGEQAVKLILAAFSKTEEIPSLFVITPFTTVRSGLIQMIKKLPIYQQDKRMPDWVETHIGTVHTFQGKEADEVIFLLGCDKNSLGAVRWVNTNIVNVAVTRAKYRLYIIGDYTVWQHSDVMQKLKCILDSYAIKALNQVANGQNANISDEQVRQWLNKVPKGRDFQLNGETEDFLIDTFQKSISDTWSASADLTEEQLADFGLSRSLLHSLDAGVAKSIIWSIQLYDLFATLRKRFKLNDVDFTCSGIMFCKSMELQLKIYMLNGLQHVLADFPIRKGVMLSQVNEKKVTIGTFTYVLGQEDCREKLAKQEVSMDAVLCNRNWWNNYYNNLEQFRVLRNRCCHTDPFEWSHVEQLIEVLFGQQIFLKTLVGEKLK